MNEILYNPKIKQEHLARKAIVYLRQSSEKQVRQNTESQRLQYDMAERVRGLGWQEVEIINTDLGTSAAIGAVYREGFERVLSSVALGEVGIVASREVSRLSRTDKDWCRLVEVCQIFGTLIGDEQQVYDLSYLDDQLVLGIKGTLSVGVVERGGEIRLRVEKRKRASKKALHAFVAETVSPDAGRLMTDEARGYRGIADADTTHETVNHRAEEWVRGDVHTNSVEGVWSLFKRSIVGSYHQISTKHMDAYLDEFEWRFNQRDNPYLFRDTLVRLLNSPKMEFKELIDKGAYSGGNPSNPDIR